VVIDPWLICPGYSAKISDYDVQRLGIRDREDALLLVIVSVKDRIDEMTANLIGPICSTCAKGAGRRWSSRTAWTIRPRTTILEGWKGPKSGAPPPAGGTIRGRRKFKQPRRRHAGSDKEVKSKHNDQ
jgi:hypothetical protein